MNRLTIATNIAVIVVCVILLGSLAYDRFWRTQQTPASQTRRLLGQRLPRLGQLPVGRAGTVTLFASSRCPYCVESMPFYRSLIAAKANLGCDVKVVVAGPEGRDTRRDLEDYLKGQSVSADGTEVVPFTRAGVFVTPTVAIQDSTGIVKWLWVGSLPDAAKNEVVLSMSSLCAN
jgi:hypothetical protein